MPGEDYVVDRSRQWTVKAFELIRDRKMTAETKVTGKLTTVRVAGPCPRCGDPIIVVQPWTIPAPRTFTHSRDVHLETRKAAPVRVVVTCNCGEPHPKQDKVDGCGTSFAVEIPR